MQTPLDNTKMSAIGVRGFYRDKNIFITGASGFVGISLLEKILRSIPEHGYIYLLLRPKKGKEIHERLEEMKKNSVFEVLLKDQNVDELFSKVKAVAGDVGQENLGLSDGDRNLLISKINIIFHSAATLDFGETLKETVNINLLGTRRITQLAKECSKLDALVHVSSAYVNSWRLDADEKVYPLPKDPADLIALVNKLSPEELEEQTPTILGNHPNPYTITKHMAEHEIVNVEEIFPCTIVRPSMIVGSWKEPTPGWTISKNGPQGFLMGAAKGVIRRLPIGKDLVYDYVPVDIVVNTLITAGFYAGIMKPKRITVYHAGSSTKNPFRWASVEDSINDYLHRYPLKSAVWYPHLKLLPSLTWYKISALFVHIFPAILLDTVTRITGGRPILMKLHRNVNSSLDKLDKFIFTEWRFSSVKAMDLQDWLIESDRIDFNIDLGDLVWKDYFNELAKGARVYLNKEPLKNLAAAKKKDNILLGIHLVWQLSIFLMIWFIFCCFTGLGWSDASIIVPIFFILYQFL